MMPVRVIEEKRDGHALEPGVLRDFLEAYLAGAVTDYQMSAFLMAVVLRGMDPAELDTLVEVMLESGAVMEWPDLPGPRVDKHSTGGVGDKVSLVLAPLAAEMGLYVPMMSGRGLGHTGGTLDKLEAIPGFRTGLGLEEFRSLVRSEGFAMIGQTDEIAPLDRRLYALRSVTGTVQSLPLISASIMSKKLAEGLSGLVLDVKTGTGAFLPEGQRSLELARTMVGIGTARGVRTTARITAMDRPLGWGLGNALEVREALDCLRGGGPDDLREVTLVLAAEMLLVGGMEADPAAALRRAGDVLDSGAALERFVRVAARQGADVRTLQDPDLLPTAPEIREVSASRGGWIHEVDPVALGWGVIELGGGRTRLEDPPIDPRVGFVLAVRPGGRVEKGDPLGWVHAADQEGVTAGAATLASAVVLGEEPGASLLPLVGERVTGG
jgi:thymidine phosphorylase